MNTLGMYDLKPGDWVLLGDNYFMGENSAWKEVNFLTPGGGCHFYGTMNFYGGTEIEAILRPNLILRDRLDRILIDLNKPKGGFNGLIVSDDGVCFGMDIIHPRKEETSNSVLPLRAELKEMDARIYQMLKKLDEIEKILLQSQSK